MHLIEDPPAQLALDNAIEKWEGTPIAWEAITWVLLHDPKVGVPMTEDGMLRSFTYEGAKSIKQPTIVVVYEIVGKHEIVVKDALFKEPEYGQAGTA
ncbi:MAG: hypothetical protein M9905_07940 [Rhizobiaceae bacterium]|nr:hypothetical protein [Rhizobiaceae bacterium]